MSIFTYKTKINVTVYGLDKDGHTDPSQQVGLTMFGACFKHAIRKIKETVNGAFYTMGTVEEGDYGSFSADHRESENIRDELLAQSVADAKYAAKRKARENAKKAAVAVALEEYDLADLAAMDVLEYDDRRAGVDA